MAMKLTNIGKNCTLMLCACTGCGSTGCGHIEEYHWNTNDVNNANVVVRLMIIRLLEGDSSLDEILENFVELYDAEGKNADGPVLIKQAIAAKLAQNKTWKTCPTCEDLYTRGRITFGEVIYLPLASQACSKHK